MTYELHLRRFAVTVRDRETGVNFKTFITLDKTQLQAAGLIGLSSKEVITRTFDAKGVDVVSIGKAERRTVSLNLEALFFGALDPLEADECIKWDYFHGVGAGEGESV